MTRKTVLFILIMFFALSLAGCAEKSPTPPSPAPSADAAVSETTAESPDRVIINRYVFEPAELIVTAGSPVTWKNNDMVVHTIVSPGLLESEILNRGDIFKFQFTTPGEYSYHCGIHPSMKGKIIVK